MPWVLPNGWVIPSWNTAQQGGPKAGPAPAFAGSQPNQPQNQPVRNPMFGRPGWTYTNVSQVSGTGPFPRLSQGTGLTGKGANRQKDGFLAGGYISTNNYQPDGFDYQPRVNENWLQRINKHGYAATNGRELVGTYEPHDFTPAEYGLRMSRAAPNWQEMTYPPGWRNTTGWQQVARYNLYQQMAQARPIDQQAYFLPYILQPNVASTLPSSGGMGRVLGS